MIRGERQSRSSWIAQQMMKTDSTLCSLTRLIRLGRENLQPIGLRNSTPTKWTSPATCCLFTLAWMGGIPAGTNADEVIEGAGIVSVTTSLIARALGQVINDPNPLISRVLASSRNCSPWASLPRMNRGICRCMRGNRLRSSVNCDIASLWRIGFSVAPIGTPVLVLNWVAI